MRFRDDHNNRSGRNDDSIKSTGDFNVIIICIILALAFIAMVD